MRSDIQGGKSFIGFLGGSRGSGVGVICYLQDQSWRELWDHLNLVPFLTDKKMEIQKVTCLRSPQLVMVEPGGAHLLSVTTPACPCHAVPPPPPRPNPSPTTEIIQVKTSLLTLRSNLGSVTTHPSRTDNSNLHVIINNIPFHYRKCPSLNTILLGHLKLRDQLRILLILHHSKNYYTTLHKI